MKRMIVPNFAAGAASPRPCRTSHHQSRCWLLQFRQRCRLSAAAAAGGLIVLLGSPVWAQVTATTTIDGVFLSRGGMLTPAALSGQVTEIGTLGLSFDGPAFNNNSTVAFSNRGITDGTATAAVLLKKLDQPLTVIAKTGDPAPVPGGGVFAEVGIPFDDLVLNNNDDVAFIAVYTDDGGATFKMGVFLKPDGQPMVPIVLNGDTLPGTGGGVECATTFGDDPIAPPNPDLGSIDGPWMNDLQVVVFKTDAICGGTGGFGESAFAKRPGMPIETAVLIGEPAPPPVGGTIESVEFGHPAINNANVLAWHSSLPDETELIFTRTLGGPIEIAVQQGTAAPRTAGVFGSLSAPAINQSGLLQFHADITGDPAVTQGVFSFDGGTLSAIAIEGDPMPGTSANFCTGIEEGSVSDDGRFVFMNENNDGNCPPFGVFATAPGGTPLSAIALEDEAAPRTGGGVFGFGCISFDCTADGTTVFDEPSINDSGDVVFIGAVVIPLSSNLLNISTRLNVLTGDNALIGGFIIIGDDPKKVIVRAIGPSLPLGGSTGVLADPVLELHEPDGSVVTNDNWRETQEQEIIDSTIPPDNELESAIVATLEPGAYTAIVRGKNGGSGVALVEAYDLDQGAASRSANISTRGFVETADNVMIGGFIVGGGGGGDVTVLLRAIGPSLTALGVPGALQDPTLELRDGSGALLASNDDWKDTQQTEIEATGVPPTDDRESAILSTLPPGAFTAIVRGTLDTTGVGLVEIYHLQ